MSTPFDKLESLFLEALERAPDERAAYLDEACRGDPERRAAVERLLAADARAAERVEVFRPFADEPADPHAGRRLGAWRLVERIATGGMGVVYRATRDDDMFEQTVAVKLLRFEAVTPAALRRFEDERRTLARLEHPNIARLLDGGTTPQGTPYLVMEYLDGLPITRHCQQRQAGLDERLALFRTVCHAVQFAHGNLVIHRDLKPNNIFVDRQGTPKLLDFGIARLLEDGEDEAHTQRIFTPDYASPEQLRGEPLTTASDVWSLGVVLYELLTGRRPFPRGDGSPGEWERLIAERRPTRPSTAATATADAPGGTEHAAALGLRAARLRRALRGDLDRIVLSALHPDPTRRYTSAQELADDLGRYASGHPIRARDDSLTYRLRCFVARNRLIVGAAAAILVALSLALVVTRRQQRRAEAAAEHARVEAESFGLVAGFLGDSLLETSIDPADRERLRASILRYAEQVRRQHASDLHLRANLIDALGNMCTRLGLTEDAAPLLEEAHELRRGAFGERSLESALSLQSLGRLRFAEGRLGAAETMLERALELHRELPPGVHTEVATAANDLATVARGLGELRRARRLHTEALALRRATGDDSLPVAESLHNLSHVLLDAREPERARALAREALDIRRAALGAGHPLALQSAITLAGCEHRLGAFDAAEALLREAVDGYRGMGPEGREGLFHAVSNLAALLAATGEAAAAAPLAEEALEVARASHGDPHLDVATAWTRVAQVATARRDLERARHAWREALRIRRALLPETHRLVVTAQLGLANMLLRDGAAADAESELRGALQAAVGTDDPDADLVARIELSLGACLAALGQPDEGRRLLERALETFTTLHGADAPPTRATRARLERLR